VPLINSDYLPILIVLP